MRVLLPPSETKRSGGGSVFVPDSLAFAAGLGAARARVRDALEALSADEQTAAKVLKLGVKNRGELAHNLALGSSGAMPAVERYTGVLYDALDVRTIDRAAREWIDRHVLVQSALFGLSAAHDPIPAYRLSASTRLAGLGAPLKKVWSEAHESVDWASLGWILDLRSQDYAALAPLPTGAGAFLHVAQRDADGAARALNHFNKAAKGLLLRRLAESGAVIDGFEGLAAWAAEAGLDLEIDSAAAAATLLLPPREPGAPPGAVLDAVRAG